MTDHDWIAVGSAAGVVTAFFTMAMAVAVIITAFYARRTLHAAQDDSRARTRPILTAYLERELLSPGTILLVIKNFGQSVARDVKVEFDPPAPAIEEVDDMPGSEMKKWLYGRFADPVPVWAPGWSTSNVVRVGSDELTAFTVVLSYTGPDGFQYESERFPLHPQIILKETTSNPSKEMDPIKLAQQAVAALQAIVRTIRTR